MFRNIGKTLKIVSRMLFVLCLGAGALVLLFGLLKILKNLEYTSLAEAFSISEEQYLYGRLRKNTAITDPYEGVLMMKAAFFIAFSSIAALPMYAFGVVVENLQALVKNQDVLAEKLDGLIKTSPAPEQPTNEGMKFQDF